MHAQLNHFRKLHGRAVLLGIAGTLSLATACFATSIFVRWTASALLILTLPMIIESVRPRLLAAPPADSPMHARMVSRLPYAIVGVVTLAALYPVSMFEMPISQDHANHYFGTHLLVHEMIPSGRIFGWTDQQGTGYPFGDIYHIVPYFLTGLLHLVSFELVPLDAAYAFGITAVWLITAFAAVAWGNRAAGPWAGTLAGLLTTLDAGGDREGGWGYAMFHGVWPQHLSTGVWLFALLALVRLYEKPSTRRWGAAALLIGTSLWLHPMSVLIVLLGGAIFLAVYLFDKGAPSRSPAERSLLPAIAATAAGGLIGLAWVIRMMVNGDVVYAFSAEWEPVSYLAAALLDGRLFAHQPLLITVPAMVGAVALLLGRRRFDRFTVLLLLSLLLVGSMDLIVNSNLGLFGGGIGLIQYRRFSIPAKPLFYVAAGAGLVIFIRGTVTFVQERIVRGKSRPLPAAARILIAIVVAPFLFSTATALPGLVASPAARPLTLEDADQSGLREVRRILKEERSRCKTEPCTAVYWEKPGHGGLYPVLSFADLGYRWLPMLQLPANNFKYQGVATDVRTMARLGATVAVSKWKQEDPGLERIAKAGKHFIYRIRTPKDGRLELDGGGRATVKQWSAEHREIALSGITENSRLTLLTAPYAKWQAALNGEPVPLHRRKEGRLYVTEVQNIADGTLVLTYKDKTVENVFFVLGLLVFAGAAVLTIRRPRPLPQQLSKRLEPSASRVLAAGFVVLVIAGVVAVAVAGYLAATRYWLRGEPREMKLGAVLHQRDPSSFSYSPKSACVRPYTRDPRFGCTERDLLPVLHHAPRTRGALPSCLAVGIPKGGESRLTFELPAGTTKIKGVLHALKGSGITASFTADSETEEVRPGRNGTPFAFDAGGDTLIVTLSGEGKVCIEAVALTE